MFQQPQNRWCYKREKGTNRTSWEHVVYCFLFFSSYFWWIIKCRRLARESLCHAVQCKASKAKRTKNKENKAFQWLLEDISVTQTKFYHCFPPRCVKTSRKPPQVPARCIQCLKGQLSTKLKMCQTSTARACGAVFVGMVLEHNITHMDKPWLKRFNHTGYQTYPTLWGWMGRGGEGGC